MPIVQENPTYFSDKPAAALSLNRGTGQPSRCGINSFGARRKHSVTSYEDTEDGSELETFLSSCESNSSTEPKIAPSSYLGIVRKNSHRSNINPSNGNTTSSSYTHGSLKRNPSKKHSSATSSDKNQTSDHNNQSKLSGMSSLTRLGQLFKKSKSKLSVGSDSHASTIESSGIGSPTCTPDSSLSIYTNSLDGDSHSSSNSNQISPKLGESMEDKFCSTYAFDDCGIFATNMYYNVGESSVFTIYHQQQNNNGHANGGSIGKTLPTTSRGTSSNSGKGAAYPVGTISDRDDEFGDCVQPYYNNTTFSTFPNPKRCSVASAASTSTSSVVPVHIPQVNEKMTRSLSSINGKPTTTASRLQSHPIQQDGDGYLRPNEARNLRNVKNFYINDSVIASANRNGQVQQVQVDVHTPTSASLNSSANQTRKFSLFSETNNCGVGGNFDSSAGSSSANSGSRYHFDSAGSTTSAATTLVAGGSYNFRSGLPEDDNVDETNKSGSRYRNGPLPVYMNRAYFGSNSILPITNSSSSVASLHQSQRITPSSVAADCEPYCSLCASSIMGSPRQRSKMDVAIVNCKECFFSREAENHIRGFFDKLMTEDKQKMEVTLKSYDLKDLDHPNDRVVVHSAKVQIVIISHHFLQRLKDEASRRPRLSPINRVFRSKNVIAVLVATTAREVTEGYESVLPRFSEWFAVDLRSTNKTDLEFCKKFTEQVVRIYNVELSNSSNFSVFPKKVTREQPKIAIVFKKPIEQNDEVRVELKAGNQSNVISNVKFENPHTTLLRIPESLSPNREAIVEVSVYVNNNKIGGSRIKSELNMRRFDEDDVDRMAKLLPPFLDWLDNHIAEALLKHYKDCTDYTADPQLELMNGIIICKADILPTLMHFAAYYGLRKTAFTVLEEADGLTHCNIRNELDETPADIAFARGHTGIGQLIGDYQELYNCHEAYQYLKDMMEKDTLPKDDLPEEDSSTSNCDAKDKLEQAPEDILPEKSLNEDVNDDCEKSEDGVSLVSSETNETHEPLLDAGAKVKTETETKEEKRIPTPLTRRAKTAKAIKNPEYINLHLNPQENPEVVQHRERKISNHCKEKRLSLIPNYDIPRPIAQDYELPPPDLRPANNPIFKPKKPGPIETASGYLIMDEGIGLESLHNNASATAIATPPPTEKAILSKSPNQITLSNNASETGVSSTLPQQQHSELQEVMNSKAASSKSDDVTLDAADEQLIELLNDFKNKTYDIKMVELLFENWKQRPDVQRSIEKKMEMLDKLRDEYRKIQHQQSKGTKKTVLDKIRTSITKRKKSTSHTSPVSRVPPLTKQSLDNGSNANGLVSPTALTFTGPYLPLQTANLGASAVPPSPNPNVMELSRVSDSSYRTSIDSRLSDSSADSDKPTSESSTNSSKSTAPLPPEYNNPLSKRFIASYVYPNPVPQTTAESEGNGADAGPTQPAGVGTLDNAYQVPPPPRPVKPTRKTPLDEQKTSPSVLRKPPAIPEEPMVSPSNSRLPPAVPAKPRPKYLGTEASSPPPAPPPRNNNTPNMFSYIDYKQKDQQSREISPSPGKKSYENMGAQENI